MNWISENKTLFISIALFIVAGLKALNYITVDQATALAALIGGLGLAAVHSAIKKNHEDIMESRQILESWRRNN